MLQGPHGPFFRQLAAMIRAAGCDVERIGFNGGDQAFWRGNDGYVAFDAEPETWESWISDYLDRTSTTDIVLYGEPRPVHRSALDIARARGIRTHIFEEGYLRPYWATYEREGTNGHSRLMSMSVDDIIASLGADPTELPEAPARWGEMRQHVFYGALYHAFVMTGRRAYPLYKSHRNITVAREFRLYFRRLLLMPFHRLQRSIATRRLRNSGHPYHLVLLQLAHDASFQTYSGFARIDQFLEVVLNGFRYGAPAHHHLVFKAHPLEDGRAPLAREIHRLAAALGVSDRVHFLIGGKLAPLLDPAASVVTVNSTAAQQALWRGLPVKAFGRAIYDKPEFVSDQPVARFFAAPRKPDLAAYRSYRQYLLKTSQLRGGYYSRTGRRTLLRQVVDLMLDDESPYDTLAVAGAAPPQQVRLIR